MAKYTGTFPDLSNLSGDIVASKAIHCAYPAGTAKKTYTYPDGKPRPPYKVALQTAYGDRKGWGKQTKAGASCDVFAGTVMRASGYDKKFPRGLDEDYKYLPKHTELFQSIKPTKMADLKPGDLIIYQKKDGGGHICVYTGGGYVKEAGYVTKRYPCTVKCKADYYTPSKYKKFKKFGVYRPKKVIRRYLTVGDISVQVKYLQEYLNWCIDAELATDTEYGEKTREAVIAFQKAYGLKPDGEFGEASLAMAKTVDKTSKGDTTEAMMQILDISNWQGVVAESTFANMKKDIPWVFIRCSYTHQKSPFSMDKDKSFEQNIANAYAAGMKIGVYHYSQATSVAEAKKEAEYVLSIIKKHNAKIVLEVVFDFEFGGRLNATVAKKAGKNGCLDICNAFCNAVEAAGFKSMVYANLNTLNNYISVKLPEQRKIWVAQYNNKLDYKHPCYMWQYTSSGRVQGVGGKVDLSYYVGQEPKPYTPTTYPGAFPTLPKRGYFKKGDKGAEVKKLQNLILWLGYSIGKSGADGEYGKATANAVLQYEKDYKLKYKDGEWGKECQNKAKTIKK